MGLIGIKCNEICITRIFWEFSDGDLMKDLRIKSNAVVSGCLLY